MQWIDTLARLTHQISVTATDAVFKFSVAAFLSEQFVQQSFRNRKISREKFDFQKASGCCKMCLLCFQFLCSVPKMPSGLRYITY